MKMKDVRTRSMDTCKMLPLVPMALPTVYIPLLPVARVPGRFARESFRP